MNKSPPSGGAGGAGRTRPGVEELYDIPIGARPPFYVAFFHFVVFLAVGLTLCYFSVSLIRPVILTIYSIATNF